MIIMPGSVPVLQGVFYSGNMSRIARAVIAGEPHHVIQRGNRREDVFHTVEDRSVYIALLGEYARLHGLALWAWCLMSNHIHLVAENSGTDP